MKLASLSISRFTVFEDVELSFGSELNVFIGENATGKSHLLKLLYVILDTVRRFVHNEGLGGIGTEERSLDVLTAELLRSVFLPDELGRLVNRGRPGAKTAVVRCTWDSSAWFEFDLFSQGRLRTRISSESDFLSLAKAVFLPPREVLSIYPGFAAAWLKRESAFDRTYYDLCVELGLNELRAGARGAPRAGLIAPLETAIQARVHKKNDKFYLKYTDGNDTEAPLAAEGHRKLGMVAFLLATGSLTDNGYIIWDEPEASLNPKLSRATGDLLEGLGKLGIQRFVATHDYILASELSLRPDAKAPDSSGTRFFALGRGPARKIVVEAGARLADLENNPILDAFVDLHARERAAFARGQETE